MPEVISNSCTTNFDLSQSPVVKKFQKGLFDAFRKGLMTHDMYSVNEQKFFIKTIFKALEDKTPFTVMQRMFLDSYIWTKPLPLSIVKMLRNNNALDNNIYIKETGGEYYINIKAIIDNQPTEPLLPIAQAPLIKQETNEEAILTAQLLQRTIQSFIDGKELQENVGKLLIANGIGTLKDLVQKKWVEVPSYKLGKKGLGPVGKNQLYDFLESKGLFLNMDISKYKGMATAE